MFILFCLVACKEQQVDRVYGKQDVICNPPIQSGTLTEEQMAQIIYNAKHNIAQGDSQPTTSMQMFVKIDSVR